MTINESERLAKLHYKTAINFTPTCSREKTDRVIELTDSQISEISSAFASEGKKGQVRGQFFFNPANYLNFGMIIRWNIWKSQSKIHFVEEAGQSPINVMDQVLNIAADTFRGKRGYELTCHMLDELSVIGIDLKHSSLTLAASNKFLIPPMLKRLPKILTIIKAICPDVTDIDDILGK